MLTDMDLYHSVSRSITLQTTVIQTFHRLYSRAIRQTLRPGNGYIPLLRRHNERDGVSNFQPQDCLLHCLFRHRPKKSSKFRVTGLCEGNSPVTGAFPAQRTSNVENVSIWWRHHAWVKWVITGSGYCLALAITRPTTGTLEAKFSGSWIKDAMRI